MTIFDEQYWCKLIFTFLAISYVIVWCIIRISKSNTFLSRITLLMVKHGKLIQHEKSILVFLVPKSYNKLMYVAAACIFIPITLYQVISVYFFENDVSTWVNSFLTTGGGNSRVIKVSSAHTLLAISLFALQIWKRFYESQFVSIYSKTARIPVNHFILGLLYYPCAILIMVGESPKFASIGKSDDLNFRDLTLVDGVATVVFFWAWYHQLITTIILANLRKNKKGNIVTEAYQIPYGDWFDYLSSPHYIAEIIIYTCLWIILGFNHSWWCVCAVVATNQMESIISSHEWYREKFEDFPKSRKMFIPYIF